MKLAHATLLVSACIAALTGCTQISIADEERLQSTAVAVGETVIPVAPAATTAASTAEASTVAAPTVAPTAQATAAPIATAAPTVVPLPPQPAADPDLQGFSLCDQLVGDQAGGRFSARVTTITTTVEAKFERLEIGLEVPDSSVAPHAIARCLSAADEATLAGSGQASSGYALAIGLDGWLRDDLFRASTITPTFAISSTAIAGASYRVPANADAGAELVLALNDALPFRVALEQNPTRLIIDVAKQTPITTTADLLTQAAGTAPTVDDAIYYIQDGDVWNFANGTATNLSNSPEVETAVAYSAASKYVAFCRAEAGASADDVQAASSLWTMEPDGSDPVEQAAPGRTCADPAFSPDGTTIAFAVDEDSANPPRLSIFTVPTEGGEATRQTPTADEWSRFGPRWLDNERIVYAAQAEDSRSTLFVNAQGAEEDIGAAITVGGTYRQLGRPIIAPDGSGMAIEAVRADGSGASMIVLDTNGAKVDEIANGYWVRPAAWNANGALYYLVTDCASNVAQSYGLFQRPTQGQTRQVAYGITLGGFGQFAAAGDTLAYVAYSAIAPGVRGPVATSASGESAIWLLDAARGTRAQVVEAQNGAISTIAQ